MGPLETFRKRRGWTQEQLGKRLGVNSKGYISAIETGAARCSFRIAMALEELSAGELRGPDMVGYGASGRATSESTAGP